MKDINYTSKLERSLHNDRAPESPIRDGDRDIDNSVTNLILQAESLNLSIENEELHQNETERK